MVIYVVETATGIYFLDDNGKILDDIDFREFKSDRIIQYLIEGYDRNIIERINHKLSNLVKKDEYVIFEDDKIINYMKEYGVHPEFNYLIEKPSKGGLLFRRKIIEIAKQNNIFQTNKEYYSYIYNIATQFSETKVKRLSERRDLLIVQTISAIDDLNKIINLMTSRLREWYGYHFPELNDLVENHKTFLKIVSLIGERQKLNTHKLQEIGLPDRRIELIIDSSKRSIGADFTEMDIKQMKEFAKEGLDLYALRDNLERYLSDLMEDMAPNLTKLAGPLIGARLIKIAGGLQELARMPSSTIQVLGAEKALFLALRKRGRPPKHGVIFQHPIVHGAPRWLRGKVARAFAGKLSIAARVDAFSGTYIGDDLYRDLERRIKELYKKYPKPPKKERVVSVSVKKSKDKKAKKTKLKKKKKK